MENDYTNIYYHLFGGVFYSLALLEIIIGCIYYLIKTKKNIEGWLMLLGVLIAVLISITNFILPITLHNDPESIVRMKIISQNITSLGVFLFSIGFLILVFKSHK